MTRRILLAGLALGPVVIALHYFTNLGDSALFILAAVALIPLAWLIGEATEHAAEYTGPGIGGLLNATFGNAPELIIALIAVNEGLTQVVRGSLVGSVVGNLLLVLGFSLFAGGRGEIERWSSFLSFGIIAIAIGLFLIPSIPSWTSDRRRPAHRRSLRPRRDRAPRRLRRRHRLQPAAPQHRAHLERRGDRGLVATPVDHRARHRHGDHGARGRDPRRLARDVRPQGPPLRLLRRRGDRRDRRERGRARWRGDRGATAARSSSLPRSRCRPRPRWRCS